MDDEVIVILLNCPRCDLAHDVSARIAYDRIYCSGCDNWLMLAFHRNGNAYFVVVQPPVSYPGEKK